MTSWDGYAPAVGPGCPNAGEKRGGTRMAEPLIPGMRRFAGFLIVLVSVAGCAGRPPVDMRQLDELTSMPPAGVRESDLPERREAVSPARREAPPEKPAARKQQPQRSFQKGFTRRVITEAEISKLSAKDPYLTPTNAMEILARLNIRAKYYISEDIKNKRPIKVPNDFRAYIDWTAMPQSVAALAGVPKLILVVKEIPFIGWYEKGKLEGDAQICIGKQSPWTKAGIYEVLDKDARHISNSYTNAFGEPAPMPWALRVYDRVWIHTGDIEQGNCSHGCINLPLANSIALFEWAELKTPVIIVESLRDLDAVLKKFKSRGKPSQPQKPAAPAGKEVRKANR